MLKRLLSKKIMIVSASIFALFLIYLVPSETELNLSENVNTKLEYVTNDIRKEKIYLMTKKGVLGLTEVASKVDESDITKRAKYLIEVLIKGGLGEDEIPSGFTSLIPESTKILSIDFSDNVLKVNFSSEILETKEENEAKIIEALVYTLTSIKDVKYVVIYKDGDILDKLPKSNITLPTTFDRNFGINKEYDITNLHGINKVTVYYIDKYNDNYYYVPVTKYVNDSREKIMIIIDELTSSKTMNTNLMSFLNSNAKLLAVEESSDSMDLEFNSYIFDDQEKKSILEEVIYTISLSTFDNYDVNEVIFHVENEEIYKSVLKTLE